MRRRRRGESHSPAICCENDFPLPLLLVIVVSFSILLTWIGIYGMYENNAVFRNIMSSEEYKLNKLCHGNGPGIVRMNSTAYSPPIVHHQKGKCELGNEGNTIELIEHLQSISPNCPASFPTHAKLCPG